ncbi:hypothetical protein, partial [Brenneria izbisi]
ASRGSDVESGEARNWAENGSIKTNKGVNFVDSYRGLPTVACRRLTPFPSETRSTSTPEFFLRKTKTSIVALEIYILV